LGLGLAPSRVGLARSRMGVGLVSRLTATTARA
jgi:hypothetical protein